MSLIKTTYHDQLVSLVVRHRDKACQYCGDRLPIIRLECSHAFKRGNQSTRHITEACVAACHDCHAYYEARPVIHAEWWIRRLGVDRYGELRRLSKQPAKYLDEKAMREDLRVRLRAMGVALPGQRGPVLSWVESC